MFAVRGDDDAVVALAHVQFAHEAEFHEFLAGAALWVAVAEVPAGGFEDWAGGVVVAVVGVAGGSGRATAASAAFAFEVFLVSDHGDVIY